MSDSLPLAALIPARSSDPNAIQVAIPGNSGRQLAWTAAAIAAWVAVQYHRLHRRCLLTLDIGDDASWPSSKSSRRMPSSLSLIAILSAPAEIGVVALAIRLARCRFADYLALVRPSRTYVLIGIACLVVLLPLARPCRPG